MFKKLAIFSVCLMVFASLLWYSDVEIGGSDLNSSVLSAQDVSCIDVPAKIQEVTIEKNVINTQLEQIRTELRSLSGKKSELDISQKQIEEEKSRLTNFENNFFKETQFENADELRTSIQKIALNAVDLKQRVANSTNFIKNRLLNRKIRILENRQEKNSVLLSEYTSALNTENAKIENKQSEDSAEKKNLIEQVAQKENSRKNYEDALTQLQTLQTGLNAKKDRCTEQSIQLPLNSTQTNTIENSVATNVQTTQQSTATTSATQTTPPTSTTTLAAEITTQSPITNTASNTTVSTSSNTASSGAQNTANTATTNTSTTNNNTTSSTTQTQQVSALASWQKDTVTTSSTQANSGTSVTQVSQNKNTANIAGTSAQSSDTNTSNTNNTALATNTNSTSKTTTTEQHTAISADTYNSFYTLNPSLALSPIFPFPIKITSLMEMEYYPWNQMKWLYPQEDSVCWFRYTTPENQGGALFGNALAKFLPSLMYLDQISIFQNKIPKDINDAPSAAYLLMDEKKNQWLYPDNSIKEFYFSKTILGKEGYIWVRMYAKWNRIYGPVHDKNYLDYLEKEQWIRLLGCQNYKEPLSRISLWTWK